MNNLNKPTRKERKQNRKKLNRKAIRKRREVKFDIDHLIARSMWGSEFKWNKKYWNAMKHRWKHLHHWNDLPHQQIINSIDYNKQAFLEEHIEEFKSLISQIVDEFLKEWKLYDKRCFKNNKPPKTIKKD